MKMEIKSAQLGLLELLSVKTCCMYLSDLHRRENLPSVRSVIRDTDPALFSLEEWNDAVRYITGEDVNFQTREEAVQYLLMDGQGRKAMQ